MSDLTSRYAREFTSNPEAAAQVLGEVTNVTWPAPLTRGLYGVAGEFVERVLPSTESDPAGLLLQFLVMFGNLIGRTGHWQVEDTAHYCNLFACLVGDTAHGRKGTSGDRVRAVFRGLDEAWDSRIRSGLSSGEGLIWHVRDPIMDMVPIKEKGRATTHEEQEVDAGEKDKRALIFEGEYARVLQAVERTGNTLSPVIRDAWDGKPLGVLTKTKAAQCKEPHISIIAHVTVGELRRLLTDTGIGNGFGNRFLFALVKRSKMLPHGGDPVDLADVRIRIQSAIYHAQRAGEIPFDAATRDCWSWVYGELSGGDRRGLYGAVTARAEAQTRRLACLFALLEEESFVRTVHLEAALDVWRYCQQSALVIFGDATGDRTADAVMEELRRNPEGVTKTELHAAFRRHKSADDIARALQGLEALGRIRNVIIQTGGRPSERWIANSL